MALFVKRGLALLTIIIAILLVINTLQSKYNFAPPQDKMIYEAALHPKQNFDGIIIGTSKANYSLIPNMIDDSGLALYNFSLNGAGPKHFYNWYNTIFLKYNKAPKYIIYEISQFTFDSKALWRNLYFDSEFLPTKVIFEQLANNKDFKLFSCIENRFPVFKYRKQIMESLKLFEGDTIYEKQNFDRGFISLKTKAEPLFSTKIDTDSIDEEQVRFFNLLINQIKTQGIELIFVSIPDYGKEQDFYSKSEAFKLVEEISMKSKIQFFNYCQNDDLKISNNKMLFADVNHLNMLGAQVISSKMSEDLKAYKNKSRK